MKDHRHFMRSRGGPLVGRATGGRHAGKTWGVGPLRVPFLLRWVFAVSMAMLVAGLLQYGVAQQQITDRALEDSLRNYSALAEGLEESLAVTSGPERRDAAIASELDHLAHTSGTVYVGLFSADGQLIASSTELTGPGTLATLDARRLSEVLSVGTATVEKEADEGEAGQGAIYEFLIPLAGPEGLLILEVDQRADIVTMLIADLRSREIAEGLLAVLIAVPLSYVLGGQTLHRHQLRAQREADADSLTGLAGRRPFRPALEMALTHRVKRTVTLALIDLDGFKKVNDRLGHSHGDRVLIGFAGAFGELPATGTAYRLGGDEFAVILADSHERQSAEALERVQAALLRKFPGVTFSAGISSSTLSNPVPLRELWERADAALYEAKRRGRRQSVTFQSMSAGHAVSAETITALTALVAGNNPMTVAFQPIWDLRLGVVLAHESLLRLPRDCPIRGPRRPSISPNAWALLRPWTHGLGRSYLRQ